MLQVLQSIDLLEAMAKEAGSTFDKAAQMVKVYERHRATEQGDRRSQPREKELLRDELAKYDVQALRNLTSREIAKDLVGKGVGIRPTVQGVLSVISRTRKQILLTHAAQAAE